MVCSSRYVFTNKKSPYPIFKIPINKLKAFVWLSYKKFIVEEKTKTIFIDIENRGSIIPEKERDRIFNRFYRIDKSRSKKTGGTGLGLAIVKHISIVHGGNIEVKKSDETSTIFRLTLPSKTNVSV